MGSFNTTCAVTKAPILEGQEVYMFWLASNPFASNESKINGRDHGWFKSLFQGIGCYPYDNFRVVGVPMVGTYQDYNNYGDFDKLVEEINLRALNDIYTPNTVKQDEDGNDIEYNEYHDYVGEKDSKLDSIEQAMNMEHSGALRGEIYGYPVTITRMAIHADVVRKLILNGTRSSGWGDDIKSFTFEDDVNDIVKEVSASPELTAEHQKFVDKLREDAGDDKEKLNELEEFIETLKDSQRLSFNAPRREFLVGGSGVLLGDNACSETEEKVARGIATTTWINNWFFSHNMQWVPDISSGQEWCFTQSADTLLQLSNIVRGLKPEWSDEEALPFKLVTQDPYYTITHDEIYQQLSDWGVEESLLLEMKEALNLNENEIVLKSDDTPIANLLKKHYMFPSGVSSVFIKHP